MSRMLFLPSKNLVLAAFLAISFSVSVAAQSGRVQPATTPTPRDDDTVRVVTEEIKLNVLAFDESGNFFRDVTGRDLVITENNILHQPASRRHVQDTAAQSSAPGDRRTASQRCPRRGNRAQDRTDYQHGPGDAENAQSTKTGS